MIYSISATFTSVKMDPVDKAVLASFFASALDPSIAPYDRFRSRLAVSKEFFDEKVAQLGKKALSRMKS